VPGPVPWNTESNRQKSMSLRSFHTSGRREEMKVNNKLWQMVINARKIRQQWERVSALYEGFK
jgi:hypothetical protein